MPNYVIKLPKPHAGQEVLLKKAARFNAVCCGRRFGKTEYGFGRIIIPALNGKPVAWFAPTYRMMRLVWRKFIKIMKPVIATKNTLEKSVTLITGGIIEFWSLDNPDSVRGSAYAHIVIDEAAHVKGLEEAWTKTIRPLLADFKGGCDFLSTPNGKANYFFELCGMEANGKKGWTYSHMPTSVNPFIDIEEIEAARAELDPLTFAQEFLAEFVDFVSMPFAYAFKPETHIGPTAFDPRLPLLVSFDFGVDPMPAVVLQVNQYPRSVKILKEFHVFDGDVFRLCTEIKAYIASLSHRPMVKITGDPSGRARSPLAEGAGNAYRAISAELGIRSDMIAVPRKFSISNSRALFNSVLSHIPFAVSENCPLLIRDLKFVECDHDADGKIRLKKTGRNAGAGASNENMTHLLDALRYALHLEFSDFASKFAKPINNEEDD